MIQKDVAIEKIDSINRCLKRIREETKLDPDLLEDFNIQDVFVLNLQRAVQQCIDLAAHIVADEQLGSPKTMKDNFIVLKNKKYLDKKLCQSLCSMVGFRNIAVHAYRDLELEILQSVLVNHLSDLSDFVEISKSLLKKAL